MQSAVFNIELNLFLSIIRVWLVVLHKSVRQSLTEANSNCIKDVYNNKKRSCRQLI